MGHGEWKGTGKSSRDMTELRSYRQAEKVRVGKVIIGNHTITGTWREGQPSAGIMAATVVRRQGSKRQAPGGRGCSGTS